MPQLAGIPMEVELTAVRIEYAAVVEGVGMTCQPCETFQHPATAIDRGSEAVPIVLFAGDLVVLDRLTEVTSDRMQLHWSRCEAFSKAELN